MGQAKHDIEIKGKLDCIVDQPIPSSCNMETLAEATLELLERIQELEKPIMSRGGPP